MRAFLRLFFHLLYHPLAPIYDLIAALVSAGEWSQWILSVIPHIHPQGKILELGHGPGHLLRALQKQQRLVIGLDESAQMGRIAARRLGIAKRLVRAQAQALPFPEATFTTLVATFPSDYILHPQTLAEAWRVLTPGGRLVILPGLTIHTPSGFWRWLRLLWRITAQDQLPLIPRFPPFHWREQAIHRRWVTLHLFIGEKMM